MGTKQERLEEIRKILGLNKAEMAQKMGIEGSTYHHVLSPKRRESVSIEHLEALYKACNVNPLWVLNGTGSVFMVNNHISSGQTILCPYAANAGKVEEYSQEWAGLAARVQVPGVTQESVAFRVEGDSMEPLLKSGDYLVCVKLRDPEQFRDNRVHVICTPNGIWVKELRRLPGAIALLSKNRAHKEVRLDVEQVKEVYQPLCKITAHFDDDELRADIQNIYKILAQKGLV